MADSIINTPITVGINSPTTPVETVVDPIAPTMPPTPTSDPTPDPTPTPEVPVEFIAGEIVEIDGEDYTIDENGNAVKDGQIFKTKAELVALSNVVEDDTSDEPTEIDLNNIVSTLNLELQNEDGTPMVFDNTPEGIQNLIQTVYNKGVEATNVSARELMIRQHPELEDVINYIAVNGSLSGYDTSTTDYNSMVLDQNNKNQLMSVIRRSRELKGDSEAEINKYLTLVTADNSLYETAELSLNHIKQIIQATNEQQANLAAQREEAERNQKLEWENSVANTIKKGVFSINGKEIAIPLQFKINTADGKTIVRGREDFLSYITKENKYNLKDGSSIVATQYEVDRYLEQATLGYNKDVYDAMRLFTGGDLTSVIDKSVETRKVVDMKKKLRLSTKQTQSSTPNTGGAFNLPVRKQL